MIRWYGTVQEFERLQEAAHINCVCEYDQMDNLINQCSSHAMIDRDQKTLDHLYFMYLNREKLLEEEYRG